MVIDSNRRISDIAKELGLRSNLLRIWKKRYESGKLEAFPGKCHLSSEDSEIRRLKRENKRLRIKRDILKKAVAIFGGQVMRYEFIKQFREAFQG
jgi:transposase